MLAVLLAPTCATCERPLEHPATDVICEPCWNAVTRLTPPVCVRCGDALASPRAAARVDGLCGRCRRRRTFELEAHRAAGPYEGRLRDIVHAWKYGQRRSLAAPLARLVLDAAGDLRDTHDAAVPVPLHRARRRERGFNQAEDLARRLGLPVLRALRRVRPTPSQAALTAGARRRNVRGAFALAPVLWRTAAREARRTPGCSIAVSRRARVELMRMRIDGRRLLLVDDVCTTGATLDACARVLREAGAASVSAVTAARAAIGRRR